MIEVIHHKHNNDDMLVVDAARASFAKTGDQYTTEQNNRLIHYLAREKHINPFFHNRFTFSFDKRDIDLWELSQNQVAGMVWQADGDNVIVRHSFYGWLGLIKHIKDEDQSARVHMTLINKMPESSAAYGQLGDVAMPDNYSLVHSHPDFIDISLFLKVPIFLARQEFTHKVGFTRSERSGRYVSDTPENFIPTSWRDKPKDGVKQGSGGVSADSPTATAIARNVYEYSSVCYQDLIDDLDIAPEQARMLLPQAMMTRYMVTGSLSAFRRMHTERVGSNAQSEIRDYAHMVDEVLSKEYGHKWGL